MTQLASLRRLVHHAFHKAGFEVHRRRQLQPFGQSIWQDMKTLCPTPRTIFDVGANAGQSITAFKRAFPDCAIHAFEPDERAQVDAQRAADGYPDVRLHRVALGDHDGTTRFFEYDQSTMSSVRPPGKDCWGHPLRERQVPIRTVESICSELRLDRVDILKIDTQGADDAVLRGAGHMLASGSITLVRNELIFMDMYEKQFDPLDSIRWMQALGYRVVSFYEQCHDGQLLGWMDVLYHRDGQHPADAPSDPASPVRATTP